MTIPEKLIGFECYNEGEHMTGIADVVLPNLAYMTETVAGAGIAGEFDTPTVGLFQSMTTTINWRVLMDENVTFIAPRVYHFDFRGSKQFLNNAVGELEKQMLKVVMRVLPKNLNLGNFQGGAQMGTSGEFEVLYIKITLNDRELVEIDKINYKCIIDGVDYLETAAQHLGKR